MLLLLLLLLLLLRDGPCYSPGLARAMLCSEYMTLLLRTFCGLAGDPALGEEGREDDRRVLALLMQAVRDLCRSSYQEATGGRGFRVIRVIRGFVF